MFSNVGDDSLFRLARDFHIAFVVDPRDLMVAVRDHPHLRRRGTGAVADKRWCDPRFAAHLGERGGRLISAGHGYERGLPAQRHDVARHVGGPADPVHVVVEGDDRDRRLGGNARHAADDEFVDHRIADDEDVDAARPRQDFARALRREGWQQHRRGGLRRTGG